MEFWKDIKGYEGLYQISNMGNVRSVERSVPQGKYGKLRSVGGSVMSPHNNGHGYLAVSLSRSGRRKMFYVHRLVAEHFVENSGGFGYVNHKDYDRSNNRADNLAWCTQKENVRYSAHKMRKPHKQWKASGTGEKYIYFRYGHYRLSIRNKIDKVFQTVEEAVRAREVVLSGEEHFAN